MYLYVLQPPKYSMVPPSPSLPSILPPTSQVSAKPRFFTIEIKTKWSIDQFLRKAENKIQPVWYVHRTWLHMSLAPSSPCRSSFLSLAWGMRPCTLCAFFWFHQEKYGTNGISPTKASKFTCFTRKKLVKFRDVITPFSGISATNGDFTSEKRCVLTQKKKRILSKDNQKGEWFPCRGRNVPFETGFYWFIFISPYKTCSIYLGKL